MHAHDVGSRSARGRAGAAEYELDADEVIEEAQRWLQNRR
jgi:hypothetical protein